MKKLIIIIVGVILLAEANPVQPATLEVRAPGGIGTLGDVYTCIQDAIDDASPGDTITVNDGTYEEDLVINITNLTLESKNGPAVTTIKGVANVDAAQWPLAVPNIEIPADGVEITGFTIQGPDPNAGKYSSGIVIAGDNIQIHDNVFQVTNAGSLDDISQAIQTYRDGNNGAGDLDGLNIYDNTFEPWGSGTHGYEAIFINHTPSDPSPAAAVTIQGNTISGAVIRGITTERSNVTITGNTVETTLAPFDGSVGAFQGILVQDFGGRQQQDVNVANNTVQGSSGFSQGIRVGASGQALSNISLTGNTITGNDVGVQVRGSAGGVVLNYNKINGNTTYGAENTDAAVLDAERNWWGEVTGPYHSTNPDGLGNAVSDNVDFIPWYTIEDMLEPVIVKVGSTEEIRALCDTIQNGIDAAFEGDTIVVSAGTYNERVNINKSLTLEGANAGVPSTGVRGPESIINPQGLGLDFGVLIDGVGTIATFDGFTVENYERAGILAGAFSLDNDPTEVHILNNIVTGPIGQHNNNCIQVGDGTTGTVIGNEVMGANLESPDWTGSGILVAGSSDVLVSENHVHGCEGGIVVAGYAVYRSAPAEDNHIENNLVENCEGGISIQTNSIGTVIRYNDVLDNNDVGIESAGNISWEPTVPSGTEIHCNNIVGNENYGVVSLVWDESLGGAEKVDAKYNWWGDASGPNGVGGGSGDAVSENVDFFPWLLSTDCGDFTQQVADFVVDDDWEGYPDWTTVTVNSTDYYIGLNAFAAIQGAVDAASDGNSISVMAGTYNENIDVYKRVQIIGAGSDANGTVITQNPAGAGDAKIGVVQLNASGLSEMQPLLLKDLRVEPDSMAGFSVGRFCEATGISVSYIKLDNVQVLGNNINPNTEQERGLYVDLTSTVTHLAVIDCAFDNLTYGWYLQKEVSDDTSTVQYVTVTGTSFTHNNLKGFYAEKLSDVTFKDCIVTENGFSDSEVPSYFLPWMCGFDINLKAGTYQNITFIDCIVIDNAAGGAKEGVGLAVKGRGTGTNPSSGYTAYPAYVNNVSIIGGIFTGNERGIRFGEPGKENATPTNVTVSAAEIYGNVQTYSGSDGSAYGGLVNMTLAKVDAEYNWWGDISGPNDPCGTSEANGSTCYDVAVMKNADGAGDGVTENVDYCPWLTTPVSPSNDPYPVGDLNYDGCVDFRDFAIFAENWLEGTAP